MASVSPREAAGVVAPSYSWRRETPLGCEVPGPHKVPGACARDTRVESEGPGPGRSGSWKVLAQRCVRNREGSRSGFLKRFSGEGREVFAPTQRKARALSRRLGPRVPKTVIRKGRQFELFACVA